MWIFQRNGRTGSHSSANDLNGERPTERRGVSGMRGIRAAVEAGDEWQALEAKLVKLDAKAKEIGNATAESGKDIGAAATLLAEELREGFKSIARHF